MSAVLDKPTLGDSLLRAVATAAGAVLFVSVLAVLAEGLKAPGVARLDVVGELRFVDADAVRKAVTPYLGAALVELDLQSMKAEVEAQPWVAQARVERAWPDRVRIVIEEHQPFARWGQAALLSVDGQLFSPGAAQLPASLPRLDGPRDRQAVVMDAFQALQARLAPTPFPVAELALDERGEWTARTTDGIELRFGRAQPVEKVSALISAAAGALAGKLQEVSYVDLRYTNGFAVGWRLVAAAHADGSAHE